LVLAPYVVLSSKTPFPGAAALPSVLGTALLIRYGRTGAISPLLSWGPFVATGKISYSLYLWHWPVTVFWRYATYDQLCVWDYAGMIMLSFLLAYLSWRFVEMPVRTSPAWTMRRSFAFAGSGIALLAALGAACVFNHGWPNLLHPQANTLTADINIHAPSFIEPQLLRITNRFRRLLGYDIVPLPQVRWSFANGNDGTYPVGASTEPAVLLVGDSHCGSLRYGLDAALRERRQGGVVVSQSSTNMYIFSNAQARAALSELKRHPSISKVLITQFWSNSNPAGVGYVEPRIMCEQLEEFALHLRSLGKTLYVLTDVPIFSRGPSGDELSRVPILAPRRMEPGWDGLQSEAQFTREQGKVNERLEAICRKTGAVLVPMHLAFKQGDHYAAYEKKNGNIVPLYRDGQHLSPPGSVLAARFVMPYLFPGKQQ
jgi:hypothetical protein